MPDTNSLFGVGHGRYTTLVTPAALGYRVTNNVLSWGKNCHQPQLGTRQAC
jgi:hypothetical protein